MMETTDHQPTEAAGLSHALALIGTAAAVRAVSRLGIAVCGFVTTALVVRMLGVSDYGSLAFGLSVVGLVTGLFTGAGVAATRTIAARLANGDRAGADEVTRGLLTVTLTAGLVGALVVAGAVIATQHQLQRDQVLTLAAAMAVLLFGRFAVVAGAGVASGFGRFVMIEAPGLAEVATKLLLIATAFAMTGPGFGTVVAVYGVAGLAATATSLVVVHRAHWSTRVLAPSRDAGRTMLVLTAPFLITGVAYRLIHGFDVAVLGVAHPGATTGAYAPTISLVEALVMLVPLLLSAMFVTAATSLYETGDRGSFSALYVAVGKVSLALAMPAFTLLAIAPVQSLRAVFGAAFPASPGIVRTLLVGYFVTVAFGFNGQALLASGARRELARAYLWPSLAMIASALVLAPIYGAAGAAIATTFSFVVLNASLSWALYRVTGAHLFRRDALLLIATTPLSILVAAGAYRAIGGGFWEAVAAAIAGWLIWVGFAALLGALRPDELHRIRPRRSRTGAGGQ